MDFKDLRMYGYIMMLKVVFILAHTDNSSFCAVWLVYANMVTYAIFYDYMGVQRY